MNRGQLRDSYTPTNPCKVLSSNNTVLSYLVTITLLLHSVLKFATMTKEKPAPLLAQGVDFGTRSLEEWDLELSTLEKLSAPSESMPFYFVKDAIGGIFKINTITEPYHQMGPTQLHNASSAYRQAMINIVRVTPEEMRSWLEIE